MSEERKVNTLIVIGWNGIKTCYLNITKEEALKRWSSENHVDIEYAERNGIYREYAFTDQFDAYDAWA